MPTCGKLRALVLERVDAVGVLPSLHVDLDFLVLLGAHHDRADVVEERVLAAADPGDVVVGAHAGPPGGAAALDPADRRRLLLHAVQVRGDEAAPCRGSRS